jgi:hypothetical protein
VPEYLWEEHLLNDGPTPWHVGDDDLPKFRRSMNLLRARMLRWWKRKVMPSFLDWTHSQYKGLQAIGRGCKSAVHAEWGETKGNSGYQPNYCWTNTGKSDYQTWWKRRWFIAGLDLEPGADAIIRVARSSWWNGEDGSRPFHWRWPRWYMGTIRDGLKVCFQANKPKYLRAQ